jgi:hypothetical protein
MVLVATPGLYKHSRTVGGLWLLRGRTQGERLEVCQHRRQYAAVLENIGVVPKTTPWATAADKTTEELLFDS